MGYFVEQVIWELIVEEETVVMMQVPAIVVLFAEGWLVVHFASDFEKLVDFVAFFGCYDSTEILALFVADLLPLLADFSHLLSAGLLDQLKNLIACVS